MSCRESADEVLLFLVLQTTIVWWSVDSDSSCLHIPIFKTRYSNSITFSMNWTKCARTWLFRNMASPPPCLLVRFRCFMILFRWSCISGPCFKIYNSMNIMQQYALRINRLSMLASQALSKVYPLSQQSLGFCFIVIWPDWHTFWKHSWKSSWILFSFRKNSSMFV